MPDHGLAKMEKKKKERKICYCRLWHLIAKYNQVERPFMGREKLLLPVYGVFKKQLAKENRRVTKTRGLGLEECVRLNVCQ